MSYEDFERIAELPLHGLLVGAIVVLSFWVRRLTLKLESILDKLLDKVLEEEEDENK